MRILLADDHRLVRETIAKYLRDSWPETEVAEAASVADALQRVADAGPFDIVLLDLWMPGMNGLDGIELVQSSLPGVPIVLLSGDLDSTVAMEAVARGARGIITKDFKGQSMVNAIDLVLSGETFVPSNISTQLLAARDSRAEEANRTRKALGGLSEREFEILTLLAKGWNNKQIAASLTLSEGTVKLHLNHVFEKSGARNRADAVRIYFESRVIGGTRSGVH